MFLLSLPTSSLSRTPKNYSQKQQRQSQKGASWSCSWAYHDVLLTPSHPCGKESQQLPGLQVIAARQGKRSFLPTEYRWDTSGVLGPVLGSPESSQWCPVREASVCMLKYRRFLLNNTSLLQGWRSTRTVCTQSLWSLLLWRFLKPHWTWS